jgi:undecaprenyl-diphosphatase
MMDILATDYQIFELLNSHLTHPLLDAVMPYWRDKLSWLPLYVVAAGWILYRYRRAGLGLLLVVALAVGTADQISSTLIKKSVKRERPCREQRLQPAARVLTGCGGGYSFPSSHASNHFALASLLALSWARAASSRWRWALFLWAGSIAYGQVYVGLHYPVDVLFGALLGTAIGWAASRLYCRLPAGWREPGFCPG